jgi:hypothetical protein
MLVPQATYLVVTAQLVDDHLWAEALSLGAYTCWRNDLTVMEVNRVLRLAWPRWQDRNNLLWTATGAFRIPTAEGAFNTGLLRRDVCG